MSAVAEVVAAAVAAHGERPQPWLVGAPCWGPPAPLQAALQAAASAPPFDYGPKPGLLALRERIAADANARGAAIEPDQVLLTHGAKGALFAALSLLLEQGDELLVPTPGYPAYRTLATQLGARTTGLPQSGDGFEGFAEAVERAAGPRTRAVVLSSPSNPTGATLRGEPARALLRTCRARGLRLVLDEAYEAFDFGGEAAEATALDPQLETAIAIRSFSKSHALCGWRLGSLAADRPLIARATAWQASSLNPANTIAQRALAGQPLRLEPYRSEVRERMRARLTELREAATQAGYEAPLPAGGFYLWLPLPTGASALETALAIARRSGLALWPGEDYGAPGHLRLSAASCPEASWSTALDDLTRALRG